MKTLKDFTPEIQAKIPEYLKKYQAGVFDGGRYKTFKKENAEALINWNCEKCGYKKPVVLVAGNPYEAQLMFNFIVLNKEHFGPILYLIYCLINKLEIPKEINKEANTLRNTLANTHEKELRKYNNSYLFTSNVYSNALLAWWKFAIDEFKIDCKVKIDLDSWNDLYLQSGVYSAIFSELVCVVSKYPKKVYRDNDNRLHNPVGAAVEWEFICEQTNFENYYIHGRSLPKWIWDKSLKGKITRDDFLKEKNEEIKAGIYEVMGQKKMMDLLGTTVIDWKVIKHANGEKEKAILYKTKETFKEIDNKPFAWVGVICPSTGASYLLGVEPHHTNAKKALASLSMFEEWDYSFNFRA